MGTIIDGRKVSKEINRATKQTVAALKAKDVVPRLALICVGNDRPSLMYDHMKDRKAKQLGINSFINHLPAETTQAQLIKIIHQYNADDTIDGILVQSPLPKQINEQQIDYEIDPQKDVDGFTPDSVGKLFLDEKGFYPTSCTAQGIMILLKKYHVSLKGKKVAIIGSSQIVGRPLLGLMVNAGASVSILNIFTKNIYEYTTKADIIISATGVINLIKGDSVKPGCVVIDVGENHTKAGKLVGDVNFPEVSSKAKAITPVPGGVGPMTICVLMRQTVNLCKFRRHLK